jgi:CubicO group peptidase (beta-lactamase class C family)
MVMDTSSKKKSFISLSLLIISAQLVTAQPGTPGTPGTPEISGPPGKPVPAIHAIDSFLTEQHEGDKFNGGVLIAEDGKLIYEKYFGQADREKGIPNGASAHFDIASISKTFTAIAVLQLTEKHKLRLDDPFVRYFPDFPYPTVTIRHMLTHSSGIPDEFDFFGPIAKKYPDSILRNKDVIAILKASGKPLNTQPGEQWHYCNTNFQLLALLVEKLSHQSFDDYIKKHIFLPAHMANSYIIRSKRPKDPQAVTRYVLPFFYSTRYENVDSVKSGRFSGDTYGGTVGDNNIVTTIGDLFNYDQALYTETLLRRETLQKAFEPHKLNNGSLNYDHAGNPDQPTASYGLGWFVTSNDAGDQIVYHGGYNYGASTMLYRNITRRRTILFFDNTNGDHFYKTMAIAAWLEGSHPPAKWAFAFGLKRSAAREYGADLLEKGEDAALLHLLKLKKDTAHYYASRREISLVGYELLQAGRKDLGLAPFRINMLLFPDDAASFGNYGIVLAENGKKQEAIAVYRLALAEYPGDKTITGLLKKQLEE